MSEALRLITNLRIPKPQGIIHVGANTGQEIEDYKNSRAKVCVYIEPIPDIFARLKQNIGGLQNHYPVEGLCSDMEGEEVTFYVSSNDGQSSSMFPLGNHANLYPHIKYVREFKLKTRTLDNIIDQEFSHHQFDLMVLDTQGSELKVLMGSHKLLKNKIMYVFAEVSEEPLYEGGCTFEEVTAFLKLYGLKLKHLNIHYKNWGEALYVKDFTKPPEPMGVNLALNKSAQQSSFSVWSKPNDAGGGVNGNKDGGYGFHTDEEDQPWWQVDLEEIYRLTEIRVYNRIDWCEERSRTLQILLSVNGKTWDCIYSNDEDYIFGGIDGRPLIVLVPKIPSRYVRMQLREKNFLHLDEVEVYGEKIPQSSDFLVL